MAAGLNKGPSSLLQKMVFDKGSVCLLSFLVYAQNQKNRLYALMDASDPAGVLQLKARIDLSVEAILVWIYFTWVNLAGNMHPLVENPTANRELTQLPGFRFQIPSQVATLMLVETEYLIPLIAPIVWSIFGAVKLLR